jgi:hypothetical protein
MAIKPDNLTWQEYANMLERRAEKAEREIERLRALAYSPHRDDEARPIPWKHLFTDADMDRIVEAARFQAEIVRWLGS